MWPRHTEYLSVEFDGDRLHNLHLFANPVETETYTESNDSVLYFGPGVHRLEYVDIFEPQTLYHLSLLAAGVAVTADGAENVRIIGRGILDHPIRGIEITDSRNVLVDGITVVNPDHYTVFGGGQDETIPHLPYVHTRSPAQKDVSSRR